MLTHVVLIQLPPAGCSRPSLGSESAGMMRHSSSSIVDLPVRPQSRVLGAYSRLCLLLLSSTAAETPATELLRLSIRHAQQLTFAPRTPAPSPKTAVAYVCPSEGWLGGACIRAGGKCRVPAPTTIGPRAMPHLICRCVTVR